VTGRTTAIRQQNRSRTARADSDRAGIKVEPIAGLWFTINLENSLSGDQPAPVAYFHPVKKPLH
jgi:hypothetical protein